MEQWLSEMEQNLLSWLSSWLSENHLSWINEYLIPIVITVLITIGVILALILGSIYSSRKIKKRTASLKKFNPQIQFHSSLNKEMFSKFDDSTGIVEFSHSDDVYGCIFGGTNLTKGNMGSIDFVTYDYEYSKGGGPGGFDRTFRGTAIFLQSDQLVLPSFKWGRKGVQPGTPPKAKEEAGSKQCPTCGSLDVRRGAAIEGGGIGDWCDHCKKSLYKMNEEKAHKLFGLVLSIDDLRGWTGLVSNTQLLLYQKSMVPAEKYQEFIEKALKIFQMFQSASQNLNEHA